MGSGGFVSRQDVCALLAERRSRQANGAAGERELSSQMLVLFESFRGLAASIGQEQRY